MIKRSEGEAATGYPVGNPVATYSTKKTIETPTHFQHNDYKNKEAPLELRSNKITTGTRARQQKKTAHVHHQRDKPSTKEEKTVDNMQLGQERHIDTTLQHALVRQGTNRYVISKILPDNMNMIKLYEYVGS